MRHTNYPTFQVADIVVAFGRDCVALTSRNSGRHWGEVLRPDEADTLADLLHRQAQAARATRT